MATFTCEYETAAFTRLTADDAQSIKEQHIEGQRLGSEFQARCPGALLLCLNFINIFQLLLSLTGQRDE